MVSHPLPVDWPATALVLLDLMPRLLPPDLAPRSGAEVLDTCQRLAVHARERAATVVLVRSERPVDVQPPGSELAPGLLAAQDLVLVKRSVGAFDDGQLQALLGDRGVTTLVLAGVMSDSAVLTAARSAVDLGYDVILVADAMAAATAAGHESALTDAGCTVVGSAELTA